MQEHCPVLYVDIWNTSCDKYKYICEYDSAKKFIAAAKHNQDVVFTLIADWLQDDEDSSMKSVISAD